MGRSYTDYVHDVDTLRNICVKDPLYFKEYSSCHSYPLKVEDATAEARMPAVRALALALPDVVRVTSMMREDCCFLI